MSLESAFAPSEAAYKAQMMGATFGHLAPASRRKYPGYVVFACAAYGGHHVVLDAEFTDLSDSPWFYDDMMEYVGRVIARDDNPRGRVFRFDGTYLKFKNGRFRFTGKVKRLQAGEVLRPREKR